MLKGTTQDVEEFRNQAHMSPKYIEAPFHGPYVT